MEEYLRTYYAKRNFAKTPEPRGTVADIENSAFVVHRHDARNLHYDLRIAAGGRLVCFAVPRGFSYDPSAKRLAVHTEDHPIAYIGFEGIIPRGEYGAGSMNIWDAGSYELLKQKSIDAALAAGELKLRLSGRKLRGEWHLVKLKTAKKNEWLLLKAKDAYRAASWDNLLAIDLSAQAEAGLVETVLPMRHASTSPPFSDPEWAFEILFEGMRALCVKNGKDFRFVRNGAVVPENDFLAGQFPYIGEIAPERVIIDGIVAAADGSGLTSVEKLAQVLAEKKPAAGGLAYHMFDILNFEGYDLASLPYEKRKALLSLLPGGNPRMPFVDFVRGDGLLFAREAGKAGVSFIIAKKLGSPYEQGASGQWKLIDLALHENRAGAAGTAAPVTAGVKITHPEKIYFPELNLSKKDLASYYRDAAEFMLPYLKDRPLHIHRFPDGIHGTSFYQKHLPARDSGGIEFIRVPGQEEDEPPYFICGSAAALMHLVNLGAIELHIWFSGKQSPDNPDWIAWDIDPKGAPFADVVKIAKEIGKILRGIGLASFIKTSGKSGLHILAPVGAHYSYEQTRMFAEGVARMVAIENRKIATVERNIGARRGRVYIDFLQNRRGQTLAAPYSVRPVPGASVSMPLEWEELDRKLSVGAFSMQNALERISRIGDIFHPVLDLKQELDEAVRKLATHYSGT